MTIAGLIIVLVVLGVVGYAVTRIPMDKTARIAIHVVVGIVVVCVVLQAVGMLHVLDAPVPRVR